MHWFHVKPDDLGQLTESEVWELLEALEGLPPIGATFMVTKG